MEAPLGEEGEKTTIQYIYGLRDDSFFSIK